MGSPFTGRTAQPPVCDEEFVALQTAYRPFGGISRAQQLPRLCVPPLADMTALVQSGRAVGFTWYDVLWLPLFQFAPSGTALSAGAQQVLAAIDGRLDGCGLSRWFTAENAALQGCTPVECLGSRLTGVLHAAWLESQHHPFPRTRYDRRFHGHG